LLIAAGGEPLDMPYFLPDVVITDAPPTKEEEEERW
jgi:hypothetical protein